ncbi:MAG: hypothetical protein E7649_00530 [Ruminococcaceae bacterium]|nr:hypothetical protein [Oscillospiraceae bacterium]
MKKFFRILTVSALALAMLLSFASCDLFNPLKIDDVEDALSDFAEDNEDEYYFEESEKSYKKALAKGFEELGKVKGGVESFFTFAELEDEASWCWIVELEETADAKLVEKEIEDGLEDVLYATLYEVIIAEYDEEDLGIVEDMIETGIKEQIEEIVPSKMLVVRKGNIVFFGAKSVVNTALDEIEDAKK